MKTKLTSALPPVATFPDAYREPLAYRGGIADPMAFAVEHEGQILICSPAAPRVPSDLVALLVRAGGDPIIGRWFPRPSGGAIIVTQEAPSIDHKPRAHEFSRRAVVIIAPVVESRRRIQHGQPAGRNNLAPDDRDFSASCARAQAASLVASITTGVLAAA